MARISPVSTTASPTDQLDAELGRLLERLQHSILYVDADRESALRANDIERARAERNLAYARSVLSRLEHESKGLKAHLLRQDVQGGLNRKREALEVLTDRMQDLSRAEIEEADDDEMDSQDEMLAEIIIPTPSESMNSRSADHSVDMGEQRDETESADARPQTDEKPTHLREQPKPTSPTEPSPAPLKQTPPAHPDPAPSPPTTTTTTQTLRPRRHPTPRAALLHRKSTPQSTTTEALLDRQRAEQDNLVESILGYASALKDSSRRFHDTLEADKGAVERAAEGMDRAGTGMEGARRRMGILGRMSEGKGWWGRVLLYAWVYGLMVLLVLVVFVLPKLRF